MQNQTLQNLFTKKLPLFILSSTRAKKEFYLHFTQKSHLDFNLNENLKSNEVLQNCFLLFDFTNKTNYSNMRDISVILPTALTIEEFFEKITFTKECKIPKNTRDFFMFQALQNVKQNYKHKTEHGFLNFETSFMLFLQTSSILLQFYDELREHKIPITKESLLEFSQIDSYEEYSDQLLLVAAIYEEYSTLLRTNNITDSLYSNENTAKYEIFSEYLSSFSSIHIELEGFISPLQYEILMYASKITPIFLHFKTDDYNIGHFRFLDKPLEPFKSYIYVIKTGELLHQDMHKLQVKNIKLYKTGQPFSQANLAIFLANKWQEEILKGEASENDFAIILPNEQFCNHLITLDSYNLFNFAMGINIAYLESYNTLLNLYDTYIEIKKLDISPLLSFLPKKIIEKNSNQIQALKAQCSNNSTIINNPDITHLEMIITLLFDNEEVLLEKMMEKLATFNIIAKRQFFNIKALTFEHIFMLFIREISRLTINNVSGGKIRVIGALEARNLHFKEVLILDFTDDYIPNVTQDDMFLNSKIRKHYNMPTRLDKENLYKHHYYNIMKNTQTPHISFVSNDKKIPSSMLFELNCDISSAKSIDTVFSYYDKAEQNNIEFYEDTYKPFNNYKHKLSSTALNIYKDCKRKFYFRYIENLNEETTQNKYIGTIIHDWLHKAYKPYQGEILTKDSINHIESSFYENLQNLHHSMLNQNDIETDIDITTFMLLDNVSINMKDFFDYEKWRVSVSCVQLLGLEYGFEVPYQSYTFLGCIDRIDKVDSKIIFYDYKTGKKKPNDNLQMAFYFLSSSNMQIMQPYRNLDIELAYYYLTEEKNKMIHTQKDNNLNKHIETINDILQTFGLENTMTDKLSTCKSCSYAVLCNRD